MKVDPIVYLKINGDVFIIPRTGELFTIKEFQKIDAEYSVFKYDQTSVNTLIDIVDCTFLKSYTKPFMIMADSFGIPQFSALQLNTSIIDIINREGLHIFLNEPLVKYIGERQTVDRRNVSADTLANFNFSNIRFEMTEYAANTLKSFQLDCISDLVENNNLINVSVYTPDYNAQNFFSNSYPKIKLYCQDIFLAEYISEIVSFPDNQPTAIKHKFMCSNWRYASHRHLIMSYLIHCSGKFSWCYQGTFDQLNSGLWFDLEQWDSKLVNKVKGGVELLNKSVPLNLDFDISSPVSINGNLGDWLLLPSYDTKPYYTVSTLYDNIFCSIVNECDFPDPTANISEKTLLSIKYKRPFVLAGQPRSLEYAKKLGFKTFNDFWDESYDEETNHEKRFIKIFETIDYIDSLTIDQLANMYTQMLPTIEHNYNNLKDLASSKSWPLL